MRRRAPPFLAAGPSRGLVWSGTSLWSDRRPRLGGRAVDVLVGRPLRAAPHFDEGKHAGAELGRGRNAGLDLGGLACDSCNRPAVGQRGRSEEHTSELQSLMRISYAVFCLTKK